MRRFSILCALVLMIGMGAAAAAAEERIALVIGNSNYRHVPQLENPENDARLIGAALRRAGFTLVGGAPQLDLDEAGLRAAVQRFGEALQGADVGLFYFAGHAVEVRGANFLVPVGANPVREADVHFQMLDASLVLRQMEGAATKLNLMVLDACRNNPFRGRGLRSGTAGLATMQAPEGTLISFATQPGNVALDGRGANSPFARALADTIGKPGLDIFRTFNEVGLAVAGATGGEQRPWVSLSPIKGDFFFTPRAVAVDPKPTAPAAPAADAVLWSTIQGSKLPALFEEFLRRFPGSAHAADARRRLDALNRTAATPAAVSEPKPPAGPALVPPPAPATSVVRHDIRDSLSCQFACGMVSTCLSSEFDPGSKQCRFRTIGGGMERGAPASRPSPARLEFDRVRNAFDCDSLCARNATCRSARYSPSTRTCELVGG